MTDRNIDSESMVVTEIGSAEILRGKGSKHWFGSVVGLSTRGLDPGWDTSHVVDWEVVRMFREQKYNKGYCFAAARSEKVKRRAEELYMPVYQEDKLPFDLYIRESFARAIVSEICHDDRMNWARYAEDMWNRKKRTFDRGCPTQYFKSLEVGNTYAAVLKEGLKVKLEEEELELKSIVEDHERAIEEVNKLHEARTTGMTEADILFKAGIKKEILTLRRSLDHGKCDLEYAKKYMEIYKSGPPNPVMVMHYQNEIADTEQIISETEVKLKEAVLRLEMLDEPYKSAKLREYELKLTVEVKSDTLEKNRVSKQGLMQKLKANCQVSIELRPSRFIVESNDAGKRLVIEVGRCALCLAPFPHHDVVIAPCRCPYHPWCATFQSTRIRACANSECRNMFTETWQKNMGLISIQGNLQHFY
jgi:hypothetical protein